MGQQPATYRCPVCGQPGFSEPPWADQGSASFDICPACGIQFGYNDARADVRDLIHRKWRERWIANGRKPLHPWPTFDELLGE
jgi:hypothetical protein